MSHDCQINIDRDVSTRFSSGEIFFPRKKIEFIDLSRTCCNLWSTKFSQNMSTDLLEKWELLRRRGSDAKSFKQRGNHWFLPLLTSTPLARPRATLTEFFNTILEQKQLFLRECINADSPYNDQNMSMHLIWFYKHELCFKLMDYNLYLLERSIFFINNLTFLCTYKGAVRFCHPIREAIKT